MESRVQHHHRGTRIEAGLRLVTAMAKELPGGREGRNGGLRWWGSVETISSPLLAMSVDDDDDGAKGGARQGNERREGGGEGKSAECGRHCYEE